MTKPLPDWTSTRWRSNSLLTPTSSSSTCTLAITRMKTVASAADFARSADAPTDAIESRRARRGVIVRPGTETAIMAAPAPPFKAPREGRPRLLRGGWPDAVEGLQRRLFLAIGLAQHGHVVLLERQRAQPPALVAQPQVLG